MRLQVGARFGPYEIVSRLGAGGMGEVWRARDPRLEREVALKVLHAVSSGDQTARLRLEREARMASKLNHPNVCTIYEVGEAEGQAYIAMELVAGQTLAERLSGGRLSGEEVVRLGQQMADALAHAHEQGVVHRDFKSANVIVTPEGRAKVLDFGLAKPLLGTELEAATTLTQASLTEAGAIVGTLAYMAPEQLRGKAADARSDVWALGVVLYEMAAGRKPFGGDTGFELSSAILNQAPKALPAGVPAPLVSVIERCLAKEPAQRYQRAGEVRSALEAMLTGSAPAAWPGWRASLVTRRWPVALAVLSSAVVILASLDIGGVRSRLLGGGANGRAIRMAVLPFANLSGDPEQEYLSDGLTQEMIAQLGRLHPESLSVIARTSVMRYKKSETPIDQIGRELKVDYVLEGSEQRQGGRVRITAELVKVQDQTQLWSESYERELADILVLQSDVARKVAEALALKLLPGEQARLAGVRAVNPEAYEAYLKGTYHWQKVTPIDFDSAQQYFELAIAKDPNYAPAYAGLAWVWAARQQLGTTPPHEAAPKAKAAALRAIALDDSSAAAHEALALVRTWTDWDWAGAAPEWRRALELNPNAANTHAYYAQFLAMTGRVDEAEPHGRRAVELDPANALFHAQFGALLVYERRYDDAAAAAQTALSLHADDPIAFSVLWMAASGRGRHTEAAAAAEANFNAEYADPAVAQALDQGLARGGYVEAMRRAAAALATRFSTSYALPTDVAWCFLEAGEHSQAVDWLEKAFEVRDPNLPYFIRQPVCDPLGSDPRFQDLLRRLNLPAQ